MDNEEIIKRNKDFIRDLMHKYSNKKWEILKKHYKKKYKEWGKDEYKVNKYASKKYNPFEDPKYMYLQKLWDRLDFETNHGKQHLLLSGVYKEGYVKEMSKPINWEEIKNLRVEDYLKK